MELPFQQRMELNAALAAIFDGEFDEETLKLIVGHCSKLDNFTSQIKISFGGKTDGAGVSGYTAEAGNQTIPTNSKEGRSFRFGDEEFRIGDFKIHKHSDSIRFWRFWASDETTSADDEPPQTFEVAFDPNTLSPTYLAKVGLRTIMNVDNAVVTFLWQAYCLEVIWGKKEQKKSSTFANGKFHLIFSSFLGRCLFGLLVGGTLFIVGASVLILGAFIFKLFH